MEGDPNVGSSSSSANKKRNRTSKVWDEMTEVNRGGKVKAACKHCKKEFPADSKDGTTRLWNHLHRCRDNPKRKGPGGRDRDDQHQSLSPSIKTKELASLIKEKEKSIRGLIKHWFDPEGDTSDPWVFISRRDEILQLSKSRKDEILQLYQEEKENLCQFLKKLSCRFTLQIANGRVLVVHYINDCWERQSKIISFWEDPLDDFEKFVEAVKQSCLDWKIDTNICFLLHVERNDPEDERHDEIAEMLRGFSQRRSLPFAGCLLDAVYFLDYIYGKLWTVDYLQDGIESLSVWADYVHNKDRRFFLLDGAVKQAISGLSIDTTFWGLLKFFETIVGLEVGLKEFFSELEKLDSDFRSVNLTKQKWDEVTATLEHLKFLEYVADIFLWNARDIPIIVDLPYVHNILTDRCNHLIEDCLFCQEVMEGAIDLFFSKHYLVRVIAVILDPRFKMDGLQLRYKEIYGSDADRYLEKVNKDFRDVYNEYAPPDSSNSKNPVLVVCWVYKDKSLASQVISPIPDHLTHLMVADCVAVNGLWNWALFDQFLPNTAIMKIASILPPSVLIGPDQFYWSHSNKGNFSVSSAYYAISPPDNLLQDNSWKLAWKWQGPQGVKVFIWLALHGRLKTKAEIARRHMLINTECDRCGAPVEDILHVLRDCMATKGFWYRVIPVEMRQRFFQASFKEWMMNNLQNTWPIYGVRNWSCFFGIAIWRLWYWRNQFWVNGQSMDGLSMVNDVKARTEEVIWLQGSSLNSTNRKVNKWIGWSLPNWPWCKLNSDGACKVTGVAAAGGLIRDHNGHWVAGFGMYLGTCSVTMAELWGLYQGLLLAWNKGILWLYAEVDSRCVTQLVKNNMVNYNEFSPLIRAIQELIRRNWRVEITHVYREANFAADCLATLACSLPLGLHVFNSPPKGVLQFMSQDIYGVAYPRLVIS